MRKREGRSGKRLLLVLGSFLFGLFIMEVALRIIGYSYPIWYTTDPDRGYSLRPGVAGWYRGEGGSYVRINSDGLRDREHTKAKPPNTVRIAVLGDSYAEALQVPMEDTFWALMEGKLRACPAFAGKNVEVINFGVSGYGTAQELITLRQQVWDYSPDIVVLTVTTNNDITDNARALKRNEEIPYFIYRGDNLVLDDSFKGSPAFRFRQSPLNKLGRWIRDNSRVVQAVHRAHHAIKTYMASRRARINSSQSGPAHDGGPQPAPGQDVASQFEELGIDNLIYREPQDAVWNDAWRVTEGLIVLMRNEVRSKGAKFLAVTLSNGVQVHPSPAARQAFMRRVGVNDLFYPDRRIKALGEQQGFEVLNLAPQLQAYAEQNNLYLHGFGRDIGNGHWNAVGHAAAAELITRKVCEMREWR